MAVTSSEVNICTPICLGTVLSEQLTEKLQECTKCALFSLFCSYKEYNLLIMKENTAKNFVIQLGSLISLYISISALLVLIFGVVNITFPDEAAYYWTNESAREGIRASIAMLLVFFPTYIVLTRVSNQIRRKEEMGKYTGLAKWLIYLSLLVGGGVILADFVTILMYLLDGEITTRFILKAFSLLVVVGISFSYYLLDVRGYFTQKENISIAYGGGVTILVVVALLFGFMNIETPSEVREIRLDEQQVTDLQDIQWRIEEYYRVHEVLPSSIDELYEGIEVPKAPTGREEYQYKITDDTAYELCATFVSSTQTGSERAIAYPVTEKNYNWTHGEGDKCFQRVVDKAITEPTKIQ